MANTGYKGIDVRQTTGRLLFRTLLLDAAGAVLTSGTVNLRLYELQDDGTLKSYDFNDNTFKTTALTTENLALTHRQGNNSTTNTGLWTKELTTLTGFTVGAIYIAEVVCTTASPQIQAREFQFGAEQGDLGAFKTFTVGASSTTTETRSDRTDATNFWNSSYIAMVTGANAGLARKVTSYSNTNGAFTHSALPAACSSGDKGIILGVSE